MNSIIEQIKTHLSELKLSPVLLQNTSERPPGLSFTLAPELITDLFFFQSNDNVIQVLMVTVININYHKNIDVFCATLSPFITPLTLNNTTGQLAIRLLINTSKTKCATLINEGIVLSRRASGAVFNPLFDLCSEKTTLFDSIQTTVKLLQEHRVTV